MWWCRSQTLRRNPTYRARVCQTCQLRAHLIFYGSRLSDKLLRVPLDYTVVDFLINTELIKMEFTSFFLRGWGITPHSWHQVSLIIVFNTFLFYSHSRTFSTATWRVLEEVRQGGLLIWFRNLGNQLQTPVCNWLRWEEREAKSSNLLFFFSARKENNEGSWRVDSTSPAVRSHQTRFASLCFTPLHWLACHEADIWSVATCRDAVSWLSVRI